MSVYKLRKDILNDILIGLSFKDIINKGNTSKEKGFIYEIISITLIISKELIDNYNDISLSNIADHPNLIPIKNIKELYEVSLEQGNNESDITIQCEVSWIPFSIKYKKDEGNKKSNLVELDDYVNEGPCGYIVKNKESITNHKFNHSKRREKIVIEKVIKNNLLFGEKDIKIAYKRFQNKLKSQNISNIDDVIEWMNEEYLNSKRKNLKYKLHQVIAGFQFKNNFKCGELRHVLAHKPRSGKTITLLLYCMILFKRKIKRKIKRILIMTPVPDTLNNFIKELDKYYEFKDIKYKLIKKQDDFFNIKGDFEGIIFCSVQFLKHDKKGEKLLKLKELNYDVAIFDEGHFHSSNDNTFKKIINIYDKDIIQIFASGTSNKTEYYYNIPDKCVSRWTVEDENYMRKIKNSEEKQNYIDIMLKRHFKYCKSEFNMRNYNYNYDNCPLQILLQPTICIDMINKMDEYNIKNNNSDYGFNCASILSLKQIKRNNKGNCKYKPAFQLEENSHGIEYLKRFFEMIISSDPMNDNIMSIIEKTQSEYCSRPSTTDCPKLFLVFLPMNSNINLLQATMKKFLDKHKLWTEYHVCYSNSQNTSDDSNKSYLEFVEKSMLNTKNLNKKGCILLLGGQGKLGITYDDCDVTISLDNGTNIDDCKQTYYRSLTEADGKTIGINVDLNIQRVLSYMSNRIRDYKNVTDDNRNYSEILQFLYKEKIFIFNPHEMNFGGFNQDIVEYFDKYGEKLREEISVDTITQNIICNDDLGEYIQKISLDKGEIIINPVLQGKQPGCNKGGKDKKQADSLGGDNEGGSDGGSGGEDDTSEEIKIDHTPPINRTKKMYEYLSKLCCLLLRKEKKDPKNKKLSNNKLLNSLKYNDTHMLLINNQLKKLYNINDSYLKKCLDKYIEGMSNYNNDDILNQIFELYTSKNPNELRKIIAAHFIPTKNQVKNRAEIPTPVECVDEMISKFPSEFWNTPKKILEPCCGKGNFVLAIFEKLYNGLTIIEDEIERCRVIIEECIYFADIEDVNIFITKELLSCHAISKLSENSWGDWNLVLKIYNFKYNTYIGDTLKLDIKKEWDIEEIDASICNPPYQDNNKDGKSKHGKSNLWCKFIEYSLKILKTNGYLLFITPSSWMGGTVSCYGDMINKQIHHLNVNECKKYFDNIGSTFSYYMIENTPIYKNTDIICKYEGQTYKSNILLDKNLKILPQLLCKDTINIMNKVCNWTNNNLFIRKDLIKNDDDCNKQTNDIYKYKVITFVRTDGQKDIRYCKYKLNTQDFKKVLLFRSGYINPTYDDGELGVGNNIHYAIVDNKEEGIRLLNLYKSDLYKFIFSLCKTSQFTNGRVMNWLYKKNPIYDNIYEYFNLNEHEIKFIENNI